MIKEISIARIANFGVTPEVLSGFSRNNFFYGSNGSGKTTISRVIASVIDFPGCEIKWQGDSEIEALVYNRDFVDKNFHASTELKGIFTLGEKDDNVVRQIEEAKKELDELDQGIQKRRILLVAGDDSQGKMSELRAVEDKFDDKFWVLKTKYDSDFQEAFSGVRGKKAQFKNKLVSESKTNNSELCDFDDIKDRAKTVYGTTPQKVTPFPIITYSELIALESDTILAKKVIGSGDVDIAVLIQTLGNSDWVKDGQQYLAENGESCPFCQQDLPESFEEKLSTYFDESYENDKDAIKKLGSEYELHSQAITDRIQVIIDLESEFIDSDKLSSHKSVLVANMALNKQRIAEKDKESSKIVSLESLEGTLDVMKVMIDESNDRIKSHNEMVGNLGSEKTRLTGQIWKYIISEADVDCGAYDKEKADIEKAIKGLNESITEKQRLRQLKDREISGLEKSITSIQPTVDDINHLLKAYGFVGFSLAVVDQKGYYKIVREDGTDARKSLSEGEKTFITFLYFYHLLKGSESESGMTENRVVVFDDPISSLDSDILFIVSNLIKRLFQDIRDGEGHIKQIFVLTHNVYFHKEVTYNAKRPRSGVLQEETFWIIRKHNQGAQVNRYDENPIKTSYELLWNEMKSQGRSSLTIQNTLRRILEHYFKILGNTNTDEIINKFDGKDRVICHSLLSWVNDGSHNADDDLYIATDDGAVENYLDIFRRIFDLSGQISHYNMMMEN